MFGRGRPKEDSPKLVKRQRTKSPRAVNTNENVDSYDQRFTLAQNRTYTAFDQEDERWRGEWYFIQMADTQFGMAAGIKNFWQSPMYRGLQMLSSFTFGMLRLPAPIDLMSNLTAEQAYAVELEYSRRAVGIVNNMQPRPAFLVVCGDLVNAFPDKEAQQADQVKDFKNIFSQVHPDIHLMCTCGNHDVGDRPTPRTIQMYNQRFGDDYYTFWCRGVQVIVLNSQLIKTRDSCPEATAKQEAWLTEQIQLRRERLRGTLLHFLENGSLFCGMVPK